MPSHEVTFSMPTRQGDSGADGPRLPAPFSYFMLNSLTGPLILRPWFDRVALPLISRFFFPLSRAWAAAAASHGDVGRFIAEAYGPELTHPAPSQPAAKFVANVGARQRAYDAAERAWREIYFGRADGAAAPDAEILVAAQNTRRNAAQAFMATRAGALRLHMAQRFPWLRFEIPHPRAIEAAHGLRLRNPETAFAVPETPNVEESRLVPSAQGQDHWLRFTSPVLNDTAWARVSVPEGTADGGAAPSLIFLHGIAMETEFWRGMIDPSLPLAGDGVRLIRPEGPWHGRRRPEGWFGGELAMARGPLGFIELFQAWVAEVAAIIGWARQTSSGPVAVGGVSLGALTAQMVASAARHWPSEYRPDALLLVATSGDMVDVAQTGSLSGAVGIPARLRRAGWSHEELSRWAPLLQPQGAPGVDPDKIVMVLGRADDLVPYPGGAALARAWGVPPENLFERPQGHFSVSLGLDIAPEPLRRLAVLLGAG